MIDRPGGVIGRLRGVIGLPGGVIGLHGGVIGRPGGVIRVRKVGKGLSACGRQFFRPCLLSRALYLTFSCNFCLRILMLLLL